MKAGPSPVQRQRSIVAPIPDLGHRIALELVSEFVCGNLVLLASKITKQGVYKSSGYSISRTSCPNFANSRAQ